MQKITHILYSGLGGHGSVVFSYLKEPMLSTAEHKLLFFGVEKITKEYKEICEEHNLEFSFVEKRPLGSVSSAIRLYQELKKQKPDIIVVHSLSVIQVVALYKFLHNPKVILVEHSSLVLKRKVDYFYTKIGIAVAEKIVYLTETNFEESKQRFADPYKTNQALIISNGVDTKEFSPAKNRIIDASFLTIGIHCRLVEVKDLSTLIEAFSILKMDYESRVTLKIAGDGSVLTELKKQAQEKNLENEIIFTGILNKKQVIEFLQNTDIYVNSSKSESMSTSIMQAMSCGLPIVASNIEGNLNLVKNNENGLIFELSNAEDLADKLLTLCKNENMRRSLGKMSRKFAVKNLSHKITLSNYQELFESVINNP